MSKEASSSTSTSTTSLPAEKRTLDKAPKPPAPKQAKPKATLCRKLRRTLGLSKARELALEPIPAPPRADNHRANKSLPMLPALPELPEHLPAGELSSLVGQTLESMALKAEDGEERRALVEAMVGNVVDPIVPLEFGRMGRVDARPVVVEVHGRVGVEMAAVIEGAPEVDLGWPFNLRL